MHTSRIYEFRGIFKTLYSKKFHNNKCPWRSCNIMKISKNLNLCLQEVRVDKNGGNKSETDKWEDNCAG